jgi:two-component system response regulator FixJ
MTQSSTVYAIDDDPFILLLLEQILQGAKLRAETYSSAEEFLKSYSPANPGCILIDLVMPGVDGLELQRIIAEQGNHTPVIFLSGAAKVQFAVEAMRQGAVDFLEKPVLPKHLLDSVEKAIGLDLRNRYERLQHSHIELKLAQLTARESEVLMWLVKGYSNKMIARVLDISSRTVEIHRKNVIEKMEAKSIVDLVKMVTEIQE